MTLIKALEKDKHSICPHVYALVNHCDADDLEFELEYLIYNQPTVEAKPVVKGEWIKIKDWDENDNALFECTNCHYGDTRANAMKVPYCWHCGAKMFYADMRGEKYD